MGVWGTAIFSDDTACDIRDEYSALLISGISDEEAEEALLKGYESLNGTWDEPVVWLALAFCEWKKGRLSERVKKRAIEIIEVGRTYSTGMKAALPRNAGSGKRSCRS